LTQTLDGTGQGCRALGVAFDEGQPGECCQAFYGKETAATTSS
jgi:hypothetical protein